MSGVLENLKKIEYTDFDKFVEDLNRNFAVIENSPLYKGIPGKEGDPGNKGLRGQRGSNFTFVKEGNFREVFGDISKGSDISQEYLNVKLGSFETKQQLLQALDITELVNGDIIVITNSLMLRYNVVDETFENTNIAFNEETNVVTSIETQIETKVAQYFQDHPEFAGIDVFESFVTYAKNYTDNNNTFITSKQTESSVYAPYYPGVSTTNGIKLTDHKYFGLADSQIPKTGRGTIVFGSIKKYIDLLMATVDNTEQESLSSDYAPGENNIPAAVFLQDTLNNGLYFGYKGKSNLKSFGSMYKDTDDNVVLKSDSSQIPAEFSKLMMNKSRLTYDKHLYLPQSIFVGQSLSVDEFGDTNTPLLRSANYIEEPVNDAFDFELGPNSTHAPHAHMFITPELITLNKFRDNGLVHNEKVFVTNNGGQLQDNYYLDKSDILHANWGVKTGAFASSYQIKQLKDMIAGTQTGASTLYATKAANLSDLVNKDSALVNLGGGTIGRAIFKYAKPLSDSYIRANANGGITILTKASVRSDIGANNASNLNTGTINSARYSIVPISKGGTGSGNADQGLWNLGARTAGRSLLKTDKSTRGSSIFMRFNTDGTISQRTMSEVRSDLGFTTLGTNLRALSNPGSTGMIQVSTSGVPSHRTLSQVRSDIGANNASNLNTGTINSARLPIVPVSKGGTGASTASQALINLGGKTAGRAFFIKGNPSSTSMIQITSSGTVNHRTLSQVRSDIGANNASNLNTGTINSARLPIVPVSKGGTGSGNTDQGLWNLGARTAGRNILKIDKASTSAKFLRVNTDGSVSQRTGDNVLTDQGVGNVGRNLFKMNGDGAERFLRINSNHTVSKRNENDYLTDLGVGSAMKTYRGVNNNSSLKRAIPYSYYSNGSFSGHTTNLSDVGKSLINVSNSTGDSYLRVNGTSVYKDTPDEARIKMGAGPKSFPYNKSGYGESGTSTVGKSSNKIYLHAKQNTPITVLFIARSIYHNPTYFYLSKYYEGTSTEVALGTMVLLVSNEDQGRDIRIYNCINTYAGMNGGHAVMMVYSERYTNGSNKSRRWLRAGAQQDNTWS